MTKQSVFDLQDILIFAECSVPVVEKEGTAAILAKLKSFNQYDPWFKQLNCRIILFSNFYAK